MRIKEAVIIFFLFFLTSLLFSFNIAHAATITNYYDSVPEGFYRVANSFCSGGLAQCWNSWAVGQTDCGTVCNGGTAWSKYEFEGCYGDPLFPEEYGNKLTTTSAACSTGDKYNSSNPPVMDAGSCSVAAGSCVVRGAYKTCCLGRTPVNASIITASPPNDFLAPPEAGCGGNTTIICGVNSCAGISAPCTTAACGASACEAWFGPLPPTPTPTPAPRVDSASLSCTGTGPPTLSASWTGETQSSACNIYVTAGTADYQISTACNGSWSGSTIPGGPTVTDGGTYQLNASDGTNTRQSTATCPTVGTPTPTPLPAPTLNGSCDGLGTTLSYSWNNVGSNLYAIRIDDKINGWDANNPLPNDTIDNNVSGTSYSRSSIGGHTYEAWVHAVDSRGVYSGSSNHVFVTCAGPTPTPTLTPTPGPDNIDATPDPSQKQADGSWLSESLAVTLGASPQGNVKIKPGTITTTGQCGVAADCNGWTPLSGIQNVGAGTYSWNPNGTIPSNGGTYTFGLFDSGNSALLSTDPVSFTLPGGAPPPPPPPTT